MTDKVVVQFCAAREHYLRARRDTTEERTENNDACRTIGSLLRESMTRNGVRCVRVMQNGDTPNYIKLTPPGRRAKKLKSVEDVTSLLDGIAREVQEAPLETLPTAVAKVVERRAREQGDVAPPRVQVVKRVGVRETVVEADHAGRDVAQLSQQLQEAHTERAQLRERIAPARDEMRKCEKTLVENSQVPSETMVQMQQQRLPKKQTEEGKPPPPPKTLRVQKTPVEKRKNVFGLRAVCACVREAVACVKVRDETLEVQIKDGVRDIIARELGRPVEYGTKVSVRRGKKAVAQ